MPIRVKLKDQDQPLLIRVDAAEWAKAFEEARETNGMIQIHEDGRTLAIKAREIVLWETMPDAQEPAVAANGHPEPEAEPEAQLA